MIKRLVIPAIWLGIIATIGQLLLLRESLVLFYGNELCIGLMLSAWLLWVSIGSLLGSKLPRNPNIEYRNPKQILNSNSLNSNLDPRFRGNDNTTAKHIPQSEISNQQLIHPSSVFLILLFLINLTLPLCLLSFRGLRIILQVPAGEMFTFQQIFGSVILCQSLFPLSIGFMFSFYTRLVDNAKDIGKIYLYESIGALLGGIGYTFYLVKYYDPFTIWVTLFAFSVFAFYTFIREPKEPEEEQEIQNLDSHLRGNDNTDTNTEPNPQSAILSNEALAKLDRNQQSVLFPPSSFFPLPSIMVFLCLIAVVLSITDIGSRLNQLSLPWRWHTQDLIETRDSVYENIAVTNIGNQKNIYTDGTLLYSIPNPIDEETFAHFCLLQHPEPFGKKILLLGGCGGGIIRELLKYHPAEIIELELDPLLTQVTWKYLDETKQAAWQDPRVHIINQDGRWYLKRSSDTFDIILINLSDPKTAMVNRYYTQEFFQEVKLHLNPSGTFGIGLIGGEAYLGQELLNLNKAIHQTLTTTFDQVVVIPGDRNLYFASNATNIVSDNPDALNQRWNARSKLIATQYFNEYMLATIVQPDRIEYIKTKLAQTKPVSLNQDFKPTAYFYTLQLWMKQSHGFLRTWFGYLTKLKINHLIILLVILVFVIILYLYLTANKQYRTIQAISVSLSTGLVGITTELALVYTFQALYGYVYQWLGLIVAIFMAGLAGGSFLGTKRWGKTVHRNLVIIESVIIIFCLVFPIFLEMIRNLGGALIGIPILTLIIGLFVGIEYPLCVSYYGMQEVRSQKSELRKNTGGLIYASDLAGSAVGALVAVIILIPLFGILTTISLLAILKLGSLVILYIKS
ncbi:MAG: hypothetical protein ACE14V_13240 [bacterium]